jgi:hypothetical protein
LLQISFACNCNSDNPEVSGLCEETKAPIRHIWAQRDQTG